MKELVIAFSQSDYVIISGGTEKCIKEQEKAFSKNYMQIFPIKHFNKKFVGINFNRKFKGIYKLEDIPSIICNLKIEYKIVAINIHHIIGYNISNFANILLNINLPLTIIMHDYYYICQSFKLIDSSGKFCAGGGDGCQQCSNCEYSKLRNIHINKIKNFLDSLNKIIERIVVPSEYAKKIIVKFYQEYKDIICVREHLEVIKVKSEYEKKQNKKIKIAYLGAQTKAKGFEVYKKIIEKFKGLTQYEWYYLGNGMQKLDNVININVQIATQGNDAMIKALKKNNIDVVILWPSWPETYSYVFYEALESGAFVITNSISGNIKDAVEKYKNGIVLNNEENLNQVIDDVDYIENKVKEYSKILSNYRYVCSINRDITTLKINKKENFISKIQEKSVKRLFILTLLYCIIKKRKFDL